MRDHAADIRALRKQSNAAIDSLDPDYVVSFMAEDVIVSVAGGPVLKGRIANRDAFAEQMADKRFGGYRRSPVLVLIEQDPLRAVERGQWVGRWRSGSRIAEQRGSYTASWRLTDVGWLIESEEYVPE